MPALPTRPRPARVCIACRSPLLLPSKRQLLPPLYSRSSWFSESFGNGRRGHLMGQDTVEFLLKRRSVKPAMLTEPGPSADQLNTILTAAGRVPDHKKLEPWRFIVFEDEARASFGRILLKACLAEEKQTPSAARLELERTRLLRAPVVVAVISRVIANPAAPEWEQILSCGAVC